jgi:hypothetical protein
MSATFTTQLRSNRAPVQIGAGAGAITFRVEAAELWDAVRVVAPAATPVSEVKQRVLAALLPNADLTDDYVLKLRGWELLDQHATLADSEVVHGSILLLAHRRRRPVR